MRKLFLSCNSAYRLRYWNFITIYSKSSLTIFVATVLTACGIETHSHILRHCYLWLRVATVLTACGIETSSTSIPSLNCICCNSAYRLRYWNSRFDRKWIRFTMLQQCLPLAVLKQTISNIATARAIFRCNSAYRLRYWNSGSYTSALWTHIKLQQCLPLAVCDEGCEAAEEQSDDEVRTSLVPDRREGKTKVMK